PRLQAALAMSRRLFTGDHPDTVRYMNSLAACLRELGRASEALPNYQAAAEMAHRLFPGGHPMVMRCDIGLANCLDVLGRQDEAIMTRRGVLAMQRQNLPVDSLPLAAEVCQFAAVLLRTAQVPRVVEAEPLLRECLGIREKLLPDDDPQKWL